VPRKINELITVVPAGNDKRHHVDTGSDEAKRQARELADLAKVYEKARTKLRDEGY